MKTSVNKYTHMFVRWWLVLGH